MQYWGCSFVSLNLKIAVLACMYSDCILFIVGKIEDKDDHQQQYTRQYAIYNAIHSTSRVCSRTFDVKKDVIFFACYCHVLYPVVDRVTLLGGKTKHNNIIN